MNVNDSLWLARSLQKRGFVETSLENARVVILNTCSIRDKPEQKVYSALGRVRDATKHTPQAFAVVAGCVAQQIGTGFFKRFPQVRLIIGTDALIFAPDAIEKLCLDPDLRLDFTAFSQNYAERDPAFLDKTDPSVFVNIMQGCDNFCTYCIVPYTRGRQKSRSQRAILAECRAALEKGAQEITLLGQNVNAYGLDKYADPGSSFATLLRQVAELPGLRSLNFVSSHPKDFSPDVIQLFAELPQLSSRLHLPLQSGSDAVLARMNRKYDRTHYLTLVAELRKARPDLELSTDLIVGFPGETEEDFQQTLSIMDEANFVSSFSFMYSDRPGTVASRFTDKVPDPIKAERLQRLQHRQKELIDQQKALVAH